MTKLEQLESRFEEVGALLSDPDIIGNQNRFRELSKEYAQLEPVAQGYRIFQRFQNDLQAARELARDEDPELRAMAEEELESIIARQADMERELQVLLIPADPHDESNVYLEIRAGTGGDEAALFAGDLYRMYTRYAETRGWGLEILSESEGEHGGYKEVITRVT
ncbi:MAG: PCRF domain-containing protein, partial [Candidatus Competibacteraceae bacterium]|nr:PCRF domain-containing protein [Candidatus Competibacteraceae bacterium]